MQDWRFDDLTRTLGRATSRRGVFKGLLGGLGAAIIGRSLPSQEVAAASCSTSEYQACLANASDQYSALKSNCSTTDGPPIGGSICLLFATLWYSRAIERCRRQFSNCPPGDMCVNNRCCRPGNCCEDGEVSCPAPGGAGGVCCPAGSTCCAGGCCPAENVCCLEFNLSGFSGFFNPSASQVCADLQTNSKHCGSCQNHCGDQPCTNGKCGCGDCAHWDPNNRQCVPLANGTQCPNGGTCCNSTCIPVCPGGQPPDLTTCQCNVCQGQIDTAACDVNDLTKACCQEQCVSTQCPNNQTYSFDTCSYQCNEPCPDGQLQDPQTCECQDLCANVTCPECQTCDPTSEDCVPVDDQTPCGTDQVCCSGTCQDSCTGNCPDGQYACGVTQPYNNDNNTRPDYWCCDNGSPCCGGNGYLYDVCQGSTYSDQYVCCTPGTNQCGGNCCDHETQSCQGNIDIGYYCCPAGSQGVLSDGTCCGAGEKPVGCYFEECTSDAVCCPIDSGGVLPDGTCCEAGASAYRCCSDTPTFACCVGDNCCCPD
ncbi:MAG: hypothetical protein WBW04_02760 [Nitrolancea sp.]